MLDNALKRHDIHVRSRFVRTPCDADSGFRVNRRTIKNTDAGLCWYPGARVCVCVCAQHQYPTLGVFAFFADDCTKSYESDGEGNARSDLTAQS
jgi:hypothetical protein